MRKFLFIGLILLLVTSTADAQPLSRGGLISINDSTTTTYPWQLTFPDTWVVDDADGTATITPDDLDLTDDTPHLAFIDSDAGEDDFEFYAEQSEFYLTNLTDGNVLFRFDSDNTFNIGGDTVPFLDITYDLGSPIRRWNDIHAMGLYVAPDTDISCELGRWRAGYIDDPFFADIAYLSHYDYFDWDTYALAQDYSGNTYINGSDMLYFNTNGIAKARLYPSGGTDDIFHLVTDVALCLGGALGSERVFFTQSGTNPTILDIDTPYSNLRMDFHGDIIVDDAQTVGATTYNWLFDETNGDISTTAKVGIDTTSPNYKLDVNGNIAQGDITASGVKIGTSLSAGEEGLAMWHDGTKSQIWASDVGTAYHDIWFTGNEFLFKPGNVEKVRIDSLGRLGIGTTGPEQKLDIRGGTFQLTTSDYVLNTAGSRIRITPGASTGNTYYKIQTTDVGGTSASDLIFQSDSGFVAIGTTTPSVELDVEHNQNAETAVTVVNTTSDTAARTAEGIYTDSGQYLKNFIFSSGYTSSGLFRPNGSLIVSNVAESGNGLGIGTQQASNDVFFFAGGLGLADVVMTLKDGGNVGIRTTTPDEALDIGNAGKLTIHSAGDDKSIDIYHDDVDANIAVSSGELNLSASVFDFDSNSNSQNIYIRGLDAGTEWANLFVNAADDLNIFVNGGKTILDSNSDAECLRLVGADSANDYADIYVDADSILRVAPNAGGVVFQHRIVQAGANATAVGPTDNFDISGVNLVYVNTSANNVTIGGFIGGYDGQVIHVFVVDATNNATLEHNEGTGNQDIFLNSMADETLTASYGGWTLVCNGQHWYEVDN